MIRRDLHNIFTGLLCGVIMIAVGCAPALHSNVREGEMVTIEMLPSSYFCSEGEAQRERIAWESAFSHVTHGGDDPLKCKGGQERMAALPAAALTYAGGLILDFAKSRLADEAKQYQAQFAGKQLFMDFWKAESKQVKGESTTEYSQKYYGFKIARITKVDFDKCAAERRSLKCVKDVSFEAVYGFAQDKSGIVWTAPLSFITRNAKAKVLDRADNQPAKIDSTIEVGFETVWRDEKFHADTTTFDAVTVSDYNISEAKKIYFCNNDNLGVNKDAACLKGTVNAFPGAMISKNATCTQDECGTFWITALVTEQDANRMTEYLMSLAESMDKNKDKGKDIIKKATDGKQDGSNGSQTKDGK